MRQSKTEFLVRRVVLPSLVILVVELALFFVVALLDPSWALAAGSLTNVAQKASTEVKTICGFMVTLILAAMAVVLLVRKDFGAAVGVLVLALLAASFTTGTGWNTIQNTAKSLGL